MFISRAGILLAALGASGSAGAAVLVSQGSLAIRPTNFNAFISVAQFDPSLGALESIDIVANVGYEGRHFGENMSPNSAASYLSRITYSVTLTGEGLGAGANAADIDQRSGALAAFDAIYDNSGASGYTHLFGDSATSLASLTNAADLAAFIGLGTLDYNIVATATAFRQSNGGALAAGTSSEAFGDVTITYTYTAIPAPGVAGGLLAGLAMFTRRRR